MTEQEILKDIGINKIANKSKDGSYVVDIRDSSEYGKIYTLLDKAIDSEKIDMLEDNQVVTEQGSSLMYETLDDPYIINLIADFNGDVYSLIINKIED